MQQEENSIPAFLNAVFGFLTRYCPEKVYDGTHISGEHLLNQSYCKWRDKYLHEKFQKCKLSELCSGMEVPPAIAEEIVVTQNEAVCQGLDESHANGKSGAANLKSNRDKNCKKGSSYVAVNGATRDAYAWSQSVDDLEVRIPVSSSIKKGKQVKVQLQANSIDVSIQESTSWVLLVSGKLPHGIIVEESLWSLVPGEHVL
ncbi:NudC domain containing 3, partial [Halocaridina rubra]